VQERSKGAGAFSASILSSESPVESSSIGESPPKVDDEDAGNIIFPGILASSRFLLEGVRKSLFMCS